MGRLRRARETGCPPPLTRRPPRALLRCPQVLTTSDANGSGRIVVPKVRWGGAAQNYDGYGRSAGQNNTTYFVTNVAF